MVALIIALILQLGYTVVAYNIYYRGLKFTAAATLILGAVLNVTFLHAALI